MDVITLMRMRCAARRNVLERHAHKDGLMSAPGPHNEVEVLETVVGELIGAPVADPEMLPKQLWALYFKAPILLHKLLRLYHPHLLELDRPLRVLMLGAGDQEIYDDGRWYAAYWRLIGRAHAPDIAAVGPELSKWQPPSKMMVVVDQEDATVRAYNTDLQTFGVHEDKCINWDEAFDVAVMFHPGFVAHYADWCSDLAFNDLAGFSNLPIIGASYDAADFEFDTHGLAMLGRQVERAYWNPTAHINPANGTPDGENPCGTRLQWGAVLWTAKRDPKVTDNSATREQLHAIDWYKPWVEFLSDPSIPLGELLSWRYSCPMQFDVLHEHLIVSDAVSIRCRTGEIQVNNEVYPPGPVSLELLATPTLTGRLALLPELMEELEVMSTGEGRVGDVIMAGMTQETPMHTTEPLAYDPARPLSSLLALVMRVNDPLSPDAVSGELSPEYLEARLWNLREIIATWPRTHEDLDSSLQRILSLSHHIDKVRQAPTGERREEGIEMLLLQYAATEIPNGFQTLSRLGWTSAKQGLDALRDKLAALDTVLAAGIGKAAKPKRELPALEYVREASGLALAGLPVLIKDPEAGVAGFRSAHLALPGVTEGRNGGGIKAYAWNPVDSEAMFEEWDSIDSATLWCFENFGYPDFSVGSQP